MASGAQLNRWGNNGGVEMLAIAASATAVTLPAYGTLGVNDSGGFVTPIGMTKWAFQLKGGGTGYSISLLGTIDPAAYAVYKGGDPIPFTGVPASSWFMLPGPDEETGTGSIANPLTSTVPLLTVSMPLVAVRAVLTASATPTGVVTVVGFAVP